jgi:hypothetical protein
MDFFVVDMINQHTSHNGQHSVSGIPIPTKPHFTCSAPMLPLQSSTRRYHEGTDMQCAYMKTLHWIYQGLGPNTISWQAPIRMFNRYLDPRPHHLNMRLTRANLQRTTSDTYRDSSSTEAGNESNTSHPMMPPCQYPGQSAHPRARDPSSHPVILPDIPGRNATPRPEKNALQVRPKCSLEGWRILGEVMAIPRLKTASTPAG